MGKKEQQQRKTWTTKLLFPVFACCCIKAAASDGDQVSLLQSGVQQALFAFPITSELDNSHTDTGTT